MRDVIGSERSSFRDRETGAEIVKLTSTGENAHLYHYDESFTPDDRWILYNSSRNGRCQWWKMSTADWGSVRLTDDAPPSVALSASTDGTSGYFAIGAEIRRADLVNGGAETVWRNPWESHHYGSAKISADGERIVTGFMTFLTDDHRELPGEFRSHLVVLNADGSSPGIILEATERGLAHPIWAHHDVKLIAFNTEYKGLPFGRRMQPELVRCDGSDHRELFPRNPWNHERVPLIESRNFLFGSHNCWDPSADSDRLVVQQQIHLPVPARDRHGGAGGLAPEWMYAAVGWLASVGADGSDWRVDAFYPYARTGHTGVGHRGRYVAFDPVDSEIDPHDQLIVVADRHTRENHVVAILPRQFSLLPLPEGRKEFIGGEHVHCRPTFSRDDRYLIYSSDYGLGFAHIYLIDLSQFPWWSS